MKQTKILLSSTLVGHDHMNKKSSSSLSSSSSLLMKQLSKEVIVDISNDDTNNKQYTIDDIDLPERLRNRLYEHQKEGVSWLVSLHYSSIYSGGILGDDMGLGKTFQVSCFLTGLFRENKIKSALIVCPVSVLRNWYREFENHLIPHVQFVNIDMMLSETTKKSRSRILDNTFKSRARQIVITSYHLVANMVEAFTNAGRWDYVILDEGHTIKNPQTNISKSMQALNSNKRLILTGTPIQNNLMEMWCLVDWVTKGNVIGNKQRFTNTYADPILKGQDPKATPEQRHISSIAAQQLLQVLQPILLQRKKCEKGDILKLTEKNEIVIWVPLSEKQREIYQNYLTKRDVINALERANYPVEIINHLKTLCRHPYLLEASDAKNSTKNAVHDIDDLAEALGNLDMDKEASNTKVTANAKGMNVFEITGRYVKVSELLQDSVKLRVLLKLTKHLVRENHRILIFSQAKMMLDIIQRVFADSGMSTSRIDGSVAGKERQRIIDEFNSAHNSTPSICLLTTRACGYGITLTGADRVIIFDPSWNPSEDRQAVDRAYRIGQTKDVVVYRMIMASSVEEKMYEKQVFKDGLRIVTECGVSSRYFSSQETKALFTLGPAERSVVMEKLWAIAKERMPEYPDCGDFSISEVIGYSRHDNLYEEVRPAEIQKRSILPPTNTIRQILPTNHSNVWVNNPKYVDLTKKATEAQKIPVDKYRSKVPINVDSESDEESNSSISDVDDNDQNAKYDSDIFESTNDKPSQGPFTLALSPDESFEQISKRLSLESLKSLSDNPNTKPRRQNRIIVSDSESDNDKGYKSCDEIDNNDSYDNHDNNEQDLLADEIATNISKLNMKEVDDDWANVEANHSFIYTTTKKKPNAHRSFIVDSDDDDDAADDASNGVDVRIKRVINIDDDEEETDEVTEGNYNIELNNFDVIGTLSSANDDENELNENYHTEDIINELSGDLDIEYLDFNNHKANEAKDNNDNNNTKCDADNEVESANAFNENIDNREVDDGYNDDSKFEVSDNIVNYIDVSTHSEIGISKNEINTKESDKENSISHENDDPKIEDFSFDHFKKVKVPLIGIAHAKTDTNSASYIATIDATERYKNVTFKANSTKAKLTETLIQDYNSYILQAQSAERRKDRSDALASYAAAINICDDDILLHGKIAYSYNKFI